MTPAYDEVYLDSSQDILGHAFDWVANTCNDDLALFGARFADSRTGNLFAAGNPKFIAGCNGAELANFVMEDLGLSEYREPHEFFADKSPEYWVGWLLAYYQCTRNLPFQEILQKISIQRLLALYPTGHEQDIRSVCNILDSWMVANTK